MNAEKKSKRQVELERAVEEARARLQAAVDEPAFAAKLARLTQAHEEAEARSSEAEARRRDATAALLRARKIHDDEGKFHPDFLAEVAQIVGFTYQYRWQVQPGNRSGCVYTTALMAVVDRVREDPTLEPLKAEESAAARAATEARAATSALTRTLRPLKDKVRDAEDDLRRFLDRQAARQSHQRDSAAEREQAAREDDLMRSARAKLADITAGRIRLSVEGDKP